MMNNIYDFGKTKESKDLNNPDCHNCNECCTMMAIITKEEFELINNHIFQNKEVLEYMIEKIISYKNMLIDQNILNWICIFSDNDKKCKIYNNRPDICQEYHCSRKAVDKSKYKDGVMIIDIIINLIDKYFDTNDYQKLVVAYQFSHKKYIENIQKGL